MKTLFLHIGTHRTATSSIQRFLFDNGRPLMQQGILYPLGVKRHNGLVNAIFSGKRDSASIGAELLNRANSKQTEIHTVILSDEDICLHPDLTPLADLGKEFNVKAVLTMRRQDLWLESWYLQNIKWQWNPSLSHITFDQFLARQEEFFWIDYHRYIEHIKSIFGPDNVVLSVFERGQMPEGPIAAFCGKLGIEMTDEMKPDKHVNSSNSSLVSEFLRCLPLDEAPEIYRRELEHACNRLDAVIEMSDRERSNLLLNHDAREKVMERYQDGNREIARKYFDREDLFLEPLPDRDAVIGAMELPTDSNAVMQRLVAPFVRELIKYYNVAAPVTDRKRPPAKVETVDSAPRA